VARRRRARKAKPRIAKGTSAVCHVPIQPFSFLKHNLAPRREPSQASLEKQTKERSLETAYRKQREMSFGLNVIGLILSLLGAVVLFYFGAPPRRHGFEDKDYLQLTDQQWKELERTMAKDRRLSKLGVAAIFSGFLLQLAALIFDPFKN
jgi:hypothetical protein